MDAVTTIDGGLAVDDRGSLRFINDFDLVKYNVRRFYQVENHAQGFIRAWHAHEREGKFVYVVKGSALVGVASLNPNHHRPDLPGLKDPKKFILTDSKPKVLWIPPGNANGFKTLTADTIVMFFSTSTLEESKGDDIRFRFDIFNDFWTEDYR